MRRFLVWSLIVVLLLSTGCLRSPQNQSAPAPKKKQNQVLKNELVLGALEAPRTVDPVLIERRIEKQIALLIYRGLTTTGEDGRVAPDLAEDWQISPDGLTYTITLKTGISLHTGKEMTAADVKGSLERLVDPQLRSRHAGLLLGVAGARARLQGTAGEVSGIRVIDTHKLVVILERPQPDFLLSLSHPAASIIDVEQVAKQGTLFGQLPVDPSVPRSAGAGPYMISDWLDREFMALTKVGSRTVDAQWSRIELFFEPMADTLLTDFRAGQLDVVLDLPFAVWNEVQRDVYLRKRVYGSEYSGLWWLVFNTGRGPLTDQRVRQALSFSVLDQDLLPEWAGRPQKHLLTTYQVPGAGPWGLFAGEPAMVAPYLNQAGWSGAELGTLELIHPEGGVGPELAEAVQKRLVDVGVAVTLRPVEYGELWRTMAAGNFVLGLWEWVPGYGGMVDFFRQFETVEIGRHNLSGYTEGVVDQLLVRARSSSAGEETASFYHQGAEIIALATPVVPLWQGYYLALIRDEIRNFHVTPGGIVLLDQLQWQVE